MQLTTTPRSTNLLLAFIFWIIFVVLLFLVALTAHFFPFQYERFVYGIGGTIAAFITTWAFLNYEKKTFSDIGLIWTRGTTKKTVTGLLIGITIFFFMVLILLLTCNMRVELVSRSIDPSIFIWYLAIIPLALMEEIAFRSYPFIRLQQGYGIRITQIIVALAFAFYHVLGGQDLISSLLGPGCWAFVYGLAAWRYGGIAVATGIHLAINIFQPLFGFRSDYGSVWRLVYKNGETPELLERTQTVGIVMQVLLLLVAVVLMEAYLRKDGDSLQSSIHSRNQSSIGNRQSEE